jgi:hypothetical protein
MESQAKSDLRNRGGCGTIWVGGRVAVPPRFTGGDIAVESVSKGLRFRNSDDLIRRDVVLSIYFISARYLAHPRSDSPKAQIQLLDQAFGLRQVNRRPLEQRWLARSPPPIEDSQIQRGA